MVAVTYKMAFCRSLGLCVVYFVMLFNLVNSQSTSSSPLKFTMEEEKPPNTVVGSIKEYIAPNHIPSVLDSLRYKFLTQPELDVSYFKIDEESGIIRTTRRVDRDLVCKFQSECLLKFDVAISPMQYFQIVKFTIEIIDINDNRPAFPNEVMNFDISESTQPGTSFPIPAASDPDAGDNGIQDYKLDAASNRARGLFDIKVTRTADGTTDLRLILRQTLDRERKDHYTVTIVAIDGGRPSKSGSLQIRVNVLDANDNNPSFANATYEVYISENIAKGTVITKIQARDPDLGENGEILYHFTPQTEMEFGQLFAIDYRNGEVSVQGFLDYELGSIYLLTIEASDQGPDSLPAQATLIVRVEDVNDNAPLININTLTTNGEAQVKENEEMGTFVAHISVTDADSGNNGKFRCSISNGYFELQKLYDTEYKIVTAKIFDREQQDRYDLALMCRDLGYQPQTSVANIRVNILDDNDHAPEFSPSRYTPTIDENNAIGAYIVKVNATDRDIGENGKITYKLVGGAANLLSIEPNSGLIRAKVGFDYERKRIYEFSVAALDRSEHVRSSLCSVVLTIRDLNDEQPEFVHGHYSFSTYENQSAGASVGTVVAEDADSKGHSHFSYSLDPNHGAIDTFQINRKTGLITTKTVLDWESGRLYYLVAVAKPDDNPNYSSTTSVTVNVLDVNDNEPMFDYPTPLNRTVYVSNQAPVGHTVTRLRAHDLDNGINAKLTFMLRDGNKGNAFTINEDTGEIAVNANLKNYDLEQYHVRVVVRDNGKPSLRNAADLFIVVNKDIPYNAPLATQHFFNGDNLLIILAFGIATLLVIIIIVVAICVIVKRKHHRPRNNHICEKERQHMLPQNNVNLEITKIKTSPVVNKYAKAKGEESVHLNGNSDDYSNGGIHYDIMDITDPNLRETDILDCEHPPPPDSWLNRQPSHDRPRGTRDTYINMKTFSSPSPSNTPRTSSPKSPAQQPQLPHLYSPPHRPVEEGDSLSTGSGCSDSGRGHSSEEGEHATVPRSPPVHSSPPPSGYRSPTSPSGYRSPNVPRSPSGKRSPSHITASTIAQDTLKKYNKPSPSNTLNLHNDHRNIQQAESPASPHSTSSRISKPPVPNLIKIQNNQQDNNKQSKSKLFSNNSKSPKNKQRLPQDGPKRTNKSGVPNKVHFAENSGTDAGSGPNYADRTSVVSGEYIHYDTVDANI